MTTLKDLMSKKKAKCSDVTAPIDMDVGVDDDKDNNTVRLDYEKEAKFPDVAPPIDMEKGVGDEKYDKIDRIDDEKEAECPDMTPPGDTEEGVGDEHDDKNEGNYEKKRQNARMSLLLMIRRKV